MSNITYIDNYAMLVFNHHNGSAVIYIDLPLELTFFQIDMIEDYFHRLIFCCGSDTHIEIDIERLNNGNITIVSYLYNKNQNFDVCGTFQKTFSGLHQVMSCLFNISIANLTTHASINFDYVDDDEDENDSENQEDSEQDDDENDYPPQEATPPRKIENLELTKLGRSIDKFLNVLDHKFKNPNQDNEN